MKDWKYASEQEVENMTLEEAKELIEKHIALGHTTGDFRPRKHMTKAFAIANQALDTVSKIEDIIVDMEHKVKIYVEMMVACEDSEYYQDKFRTMADTLGECLGKIKDAMN